IVAISHDDQSSLVFGYDSAGRLVRAATGETETLYEYDEAGRLVREHRNDADGTTFFFDSAYDATGGRRHLQTSFGARQAIERDRLGNVVALHHSLNVEPLAASEIRIERDALGTETSRSFPGGVRLSVTRDGGGRPIERRLAQSADGAAIAMERLAWLEDR